MNTTTHVVVGFDGSAPSRRALRWAAAEAARHSAPLRVVLAYHWRWPGARYAAGAEVERALTELAGSAVDDAVAEVKAYAPGLDVTGEAMYGPAARLLVEASHQAALVVVGSPHHNAVSGVVNSVGHQVATHAVGPVAIVRGRADTAIGPVVVGFDDSPGAHLALGVAVEQADSRRCGLVVARAFASHSSSWGVGVPLLPYSRAEVARYLQGQVELAVAPWIDKYPNVVAEHNVVEGHAAQVLVQLSRSAQLVVVGTRGHGGFTGLLLGSVGAHLLHHADCPVLVARASAPTA
jgi:nucleotide-binding universal stress UspA family protein